MSIIEAITVETEIGGLPSALDGLNRHSSSANGRLLGAFTSEIGRLNQVLMLTEYEDPAAVLADREASLVGGDPYGVADSAVKIDIATYRPFPFLPPVEPSEAGPYYEIRIYGIKNTGVQATIDAWERAVPERTKISPLTVAMYSLDGPTPRFMNIWPYPSLDARNAARADAVAQGIWPPQGGPAHLRTFDSGIWLPAPFSPLQ